MALGESSFSRHLAFQTIALFCFATWTLAIKYLNPLSYAWAEHRVHGTFAHIHFIWDFWWVPHMILAVLLLLRHRFAWTFGIVVSAAEIVIILVKFVGFIKNPNIARTDPPAPEMINAFFNNTWFINKAFLLVFFIYLLIYLILPSTRTQFK